MRSTKTHSSIQIPERPLIVEQIGETPLVPLRNIASQLPDGVKLFGKAEHLNPGGSVKDRPARAIIEQAFLTGELPGKTLLDATSGNTGIAYAMIGASMNVSVTLALPENASPERKKILRSYGAELILTDAMEGTDGAQRKARELAAKHPDRYYYADQYNNPANWQAHYDTTGAEIFRQTDGAITDFVAGLGTTGTFTGVTRRLRNLNPTLRSHAMQPDLPLHGLEGLKHLPTAEVPGIYDRSLATSQLSISTEEAMQMTRRLSEEEGLLVGISSGANVAAAIEVAEQLQRGVVVTILCDTGTRYLSEDIWNA